ncbi:hypothetical protein [Flavobacterium cerinum]|uniref:Uncharacterized protein n=1 Tax=Flavobacterium cerinum TaxID=2502784 RepID=A0ABY5IMW9_9FLAO|nr:hypothetical protein [Flavobacterium cerinum]UUC44172.1 hypothetical protein NOX80_11060 [Flavobacterium cerinum]
MAKATVGNKVRRIMMANNYHSIENRKFFNRFPYGETKQIQLTTTVLDNLEGLTIK